MYGPSFARVLRFCPVYGVPMLYLWAMAVLSVVSLVALLVVLAGVAHLLLTAGMAGSPPTDPLLAGVASLFCARECLVDIGTAAL
jgi:hypothetical protein